MRRACSSEVLMIELVYEERYATNIRYEGFFFIEFHLTFLCLIMQFVVGDFGHAFHLDIIEETYNRDQVS